MELKQIILYLCVCGVACFPSKPLNDRPSDLAWQAWLLVDAQNPNEGDRRITPKSVFIAPNIAGGDNGSILPECAEGYRSDPMGRCIKFVKVDEAAHLDFLLQRLNAMYATRSTHDLDDDVKPTSGPLQLNIPLAGSGLGFPSVEEEKDPEIAIIVAPTNGNFDSNEKDEEEEEEVKLDKRTKDVTTTTEEPSPPPQTTTTTTTSQEDVTTTTSDDLQALFFLVPMNKTDHVAMNRTTDDILKQATPVGHTSTEVDPDNSTPLVDSDTDPPAFQVKGKPAESIDRDTSTTIRFPDEPSVPLLPEAHRLTSSEIEHLFKEYISQKPDVTDHITRRRPVSEAVYLDGEEILAQPQIQRPQHYFNPVFNHRNRDRSDFWRPAAPWREESAQKPLVLRFNANRNPYSSERASEEQQQARYYEDRQPEEFSQVFRRKRRRGNIR